MDGRSEQWFVGYRDDDKPVVVVVGPGGERPLEGPPREGFPGFEWGYEGAGPQWLAEAMLWELLGEDPLESMVLALAEEVVAELPRPSFRLPAGRLEAWVADYRNRPEYARVCELAVLGILLRDRGAQERLRAIKLAAADFVDPAGAARRRARPPPQPAADGASGGGVPLRRMRRDGLAAR